MNYLIVLIVLVIVKFGTPSYLTGKSMSPTIKDQSIALIDWITPKKVKVNDLVSFQPPKATKSFLFVKRVVATEGDEVWIKSGNIFIKRGNDIITFNTDLNKVNSRILNSEWGQQYKDLNKTVISKGNVFVLGDNLEESLDSRYFGQVPLENIEGQIKVIF